jgi:hypothetical protein
VILDEAAKSGRELPKFRSLLRPRRRTSLTDAGTQGGFVRLSGVLRFLFRRPAIAIAREGWYGAPRDRDRSSRFGDALYVLARFGERDRFDKLIHVNKFSACSDVGLVSLFPDYFFCFCDFNRHK